VISRADRGGSLSRGRLQGNGVAVSPWARRKVAAEPFAWPALRWILVEARVVPSEAGPDHVLALMPVAAVACWKALIPSGHTGLFGRIRSWRAPWVRPTSRAMRASSVIVSSVLRIRDIGNEAGA
jgi:hypothetical protein